MVLGIRTILGGGGGGVERVLTVVSIKYLNTETQIESYGIYSQRHAEREIQARDRVFSCQHII